MDVLHLLYLMFFQQDFSLRSYSEHIDSSSHFTQRSVHEEAASGRRKAS